MSKSTNKKVKGTKKESPEIDHARGHYEKVPSFTSGDQGQKNRRVRELEAKAEAALILVKILLENFPEASKALAGLQEQEGRTETDADALAIAARIVKQVVDQR